MSNESEKREIVKWVTIHIYHRGGDDYEFTGTNGKCAVEVIQAGGYNIQRLHTRWIVRNSLWD